MKTNKITIIVDFGEYFKKCSIFMNDEELKKFLLMKDKIVATIGDENTELVFGTIYYWFGSVKDIQFHTETVDVENDISFTVMHWSDSMDWLDIGDIVSVEKVIDPYIKICVESKNASILCDIAEETRLMVNGTKKKSDIFNKLPDCFQGQVFDRKEVIINGKSSYAIGIKLCKLESRIKLIS